MNIWLVEADLSGSSEYEAEQISPEYVRLLEKMNGTPDDNWGLVCSNWFYSKEAAEKVRSSLIRSRIKYLQGLLDIMSVTEETKHV